MKRKFLTTIFAITLCISLTSCGLKNAITGTNDSTTKDSETTTTSSSNENQNNAKNDTTKDSKAEKTTDTAEKTTDTKTTDDSAILANNDYVSTKTPTSTSTNSKDTSSIKSIENTVNRDCRIFYFNKVDLKTYCVDSKVAVTDNAFVTALTEKLYEEPNNNSNFITISKDFGVKSATLDYETNVLKVVFNENFLDTMKLDDKTSAGLMAAIVNTYGYNYGVNKVAVYFNNDLYTGLEGTSENGYSTVDYTNVLKLD